jgi:hypothetical protein
MLAGGALPPATHAREAAGSDIRGECHLVEMAMQAEPDNTSVHAFRVEIYQIRREQETSLMAKGIYGYASNESRSRLEG